MSQIPELLGSLIAESSLLVGQSQTQEAVDTLRSHFETFQSHPVYLQGLGEALLENGDLEQAYEILTQACKLDPKASQGVEKFLYLGQIVGGKEGVELLEVGVHKLLGQLKSLDEGQSEELRDESDQLLFVAYGTAFGVRRYLLKKLAQGIFSIIEIWMTDLCDEDNSEDECEKWIQKALSLDQENPESWSLLASIRISQCRNNEAVESIAKSWGLFEKKKAFLEDLSNSKELADDTEMDPTEAQMEYIELVDPILTLAKYAMEVGLFDEASVIASSVQDINEQSLEGYYLEGFAYYLNAKRIQNGLSHDDGYLVSRDFKKYPLATEVSEQDESYQLLKNARRALTNGFKLLQIDSVAEDADKDLKHTVHELLKELGGPLLKEKDESGVDESNWESQI
ncbi:DEKNAAC103725 [Brettanomyces naardenensis]|uniref:DEKNAAC103725 n=1 Tax=Brettanomyces naardenensis TaxID=13370 RepID=A0A448YNG3_BRENA|nr:DEKNAAC103725 [Brettanomyces naardenensis]